MKLNPNFVYIEKNIVGKRVIVLQGGTRSGKTYSALQWIIRQCFKHKGLTISIVRATLPALKATAMRDFFEILDTLGVYDEGNHNKTEGTYILNGNTIEFFSIDNEQKIRGRKRDLLFVNEANEIKIEQWRQLLFRTVGRVIIDFNPSMFDHWIYEDVITRKDAGTIITTYRDNPYLSPEIVNEIELLRDIDPEYYKIFGMGERGQLKGLIFQNFAPCKEIPADATLLGAGLDFGFTNDVAACVGVWKQSGELWVDELIYLAGQTNPDLYNRLKELDWHKHKPIICDSAEPKSVEELKRMGVYAIGVGKKDTKLSIDILKRYKINVTERSTNVLKEIRKYKWQVDKEGKTLNEPVDFDNHAMDALRYLALNKLGNPASGKYSVVGGRR
jgi:phage terminase large subunit